MPLQEPRQRAVVDNCAANGLQSSGALYSFRSNQHAAPGRASGRAPGIANPDWRVEHEKEIHEGGNEQFFCKTLAMQLYHERDQVVTSLRSNAVQIGGSFWAVQYISVREQ